MAILTHQVFITIEDNKGMQSTLIVHIPAATEAQDAVDFAGLLVNEVDPLVLGGIVNAGVTLAADIAGHGAIGPTSDVQEKGEFAFRTVNNFLFRVALSAFDEAFVLDASQNINTADDDVVDFFEALTDGLVVPSTETVIPCDSRGEDLLTLAAALERFRRRARLS